MQNDLKKHRDEYFHLMNDLADSVIDAPDEEIDELSGGDDPEAIRKVLLDGVQAAKLSQLKDFRAQYDEAIDRMQRLRFELPQTPQEKRHLLESMLGSMQQGGKQNAFTGQFRDFAGIPDEDLDDILIQLMELNEENQEGEKG